MRREALLCFDRGGLRFRPRALTALAGAVAYGDVITSLEYKGLMVLVLGLAVWSLEVARAALDPSSYPGAVLAAAEDPDDDTETGFIRETTLRPSNFGRGRRVFGGGGGRASRRAPGDNILGPVVCGRAPRAT